MRVLDRYLGPSLGLLLVEAQTILGLGERCLGIMQAALKTARYGISGFRECLRLLVTGNFRVVGSTWVEVELQLFDVGKRNLERYEPMCYVWC